MVEHRFCKAAVISSSLISSSDVKEILHLHEYLGEQQTRQAQTLVSKDV